MTRISGQSAWLALVLPLAGCLLAPLSSAHGQQIHRNGFEAHDPAWVKGAFDAASRETAHRLTDDHAHGGHRSEFIQLQAEQGSFIHYLYDPGKAPLTEELSISVWVKANRPGTQLLARLVLPNERNGKSLDEPLTTILRGDIYQQVGRWQRLELRGPLKLAKDQQQLLRAELNRDVNMADAYVDRMVLNVYGGPGLTEVWIDDLEAGPVLDATPFKPASRAAGRDTMPAPTVPRRSVLVELKDSKLLVDGNPFFFRAIRHTDTPLKALRDAGFNTVWVDGAVDPAVVDEAVNLGFRIVPTLPLTNDNARLTSADGLNREMARFLDHDGVVFWGLGSGGLSAEQVTAVGQAAQLVHAADPLRPLAADVWDGFRPYSLNVNLLGVHRWPLMTGLELSQYRDWLNQRRNLAYPRTFMWTWVQTHMPDWYTNLVYDRPGIAGFSEPIGPQPEQIRLLTYTALAAGCRGLGFWSDRFLADSHQGRDRLLVLAMLNQELQMLEPLLVAAEKKEPAWIDTSRKEVKAHVMYTERGVLVLPVWVGSGSQFVPGQAAAANLTLTVPDVPVGTEAWEVSPGEVRSLKSERVMGGRKVTIPEFGLTAAIVFTPVNDSSELLARLQDQARRMRKVAAQWAHDLAEVELQKVAGVEGELERAGHTLPDGQALMDNARARLQTCTTLWNNGDHREAYHEAERALRPLRILMRAQWEKATNDLASPVASPYAVSFFTLPRHWTFMDQAHRATVGSNTLPDGDFELAPEQSTSVWLPQEVTLDDVELIARRVTDEPHEGKQCLMLQIKPKNPQLPPKALERTFLAIHSPAVRLQPGTLVQVSGWVRIPADITASADGALLYDSAGGEPLAVRLTGKTKWKQFTLYRKVPASGTVNVSLALTGLGTVYFDDLRIEPLIGGVSPVGTTAQGPAR